MKTTLNRIAILTILFVVFQMNFGFASIIPVYEIDNEKHSQNNFKVGLLIDSSRELEIDELVKMEDSYQLVDSRYAVKEIRKNYWFIMKIKNSTSKKVERIIGFDEVFMKTVNIYYQNDSVWHNDQSGLSVPMNKRSLKNRCFLFNVSINPEETKTIYLKMETDFALVTGITNEGPLLFFEKEQIRIMSYWSYFGAAIAIFLYNLFLLFHIREKVYLYYVIYAGSFIVFAFLYSGYSQYFISNAKLLYDLDSSLALMCAFISLFTRELLKTKKLNRRIDRVLIYISIVYFALAILIPISIYFFQWVVILGIPSVLFLLFTGFYSWTKGMPLAKYFIIAMSGYLVGLVMISGVNLELVPYNTITRYGFMIGSFIELSVFSLALGYRVKMLQDEKNTYHLKLLATERGMKENLKMQVAERTDELSTTIEELNTTNEKLIELDEFKQGMTGMLVHDLKTPLSCILNVDIIRDEESRKSIIKQSGYKMMHLVQNVLDVYKYESTQIELNITEIYVIACLDNAVHEINFLAKQKGLRFSFKCDTNIVVNADKDFIHRVLVNLFSNAVKFAPRQSVITVEASCQQNKLMLTIHNTGDYIPVEKQQQIFEKYNQADKRAQGNINSTGLGLAFCKMVVDAHKGEIGVESAVGVGTKFWFTLPDAKITEIDFTEATKKLNILEALTQAQKNGLMTVYKKLTELSVYEITAFNKIFKIIESEKLGNAVWVEALENAIYNCDVKQYKSLVEMIVAK